MSRTRTALALFIVAFAVYFVPGRDGGTGDTIPAQLLPLSVLDEANLDFNEFVCPLDPPTGKPRDYEAGPCLSPLPYYFYVVDGRVVSTYPIVAGLLSVPAHEVLGAMGVDTVANRSLIAVSTAALTTALAVLFLFLFLSLLPLEQRTAALTTLVFAFGTLAWGVASHGLWQHGPALMFITAALWCITRGDRRSIIFAGLALGFAVFARPTNVMIALPLAWYVVSTHREQRVPFLAGLAFPLLLMALYSQVMLGSVTALGQGQHMRFGANPLLGLAGILASPGRGLFVFSPVLLVALPALRGSLHRDSSFPIARPLVIGAAGVIAVHALWFVWWGGVTFGYRLLIETLPAFMLLIAIAWETDVRGRRARVVAAGVLLAISVWVSALGALVAPCGFDMEPMPVDQHPERLWEVRDTELVRCTGRVFGAS